MLSDLRHACRTLLRAPGFAFVAVTVLALGIGANTAVFSVVNAVLLRPLTYPHPEQLCLIRENLPTFADSSVCYADYLDWRAGQRAFTDLAIGNGGYFNVSFAPGGGQVPESVVGTQVSANYLTVLGLQPEQGHDFTDAEDTPSGPKVVMLSDHFWRAHFGADPAAVGRRLMVDGVAREIVGVLPPAVRFPRRSEIVVPLGDTRREENTVKRGNHTGFLVLGRLRPGMTAAQGSRELNGIAAQLARQYPDSNAGVNVNLHRLSDYIVGDDRKTLLLLLGAVTGVLLIACANVANLQLARTSARTRELAVRAALGAGRARLVRQLLAESVLLGALGGGAGLLLAMWLLDAIVALSASLPHFQEARLDPVVLTFSGIVSAGTGVLAGLWPAWRLSRIDTMVAALRETNTRGASSGVGQGRARAALVVTQVALAVVLLAATGLVLRGFYAALTAPLGFRPDGLLTAFIALPEAQYPKEKVRQFDHDLLARVRALPEVAAVAVALNAPFGGMDWESPLHLTGTPENPPGQDPAGQFSFASPGYFALMGMPILRGRDFGPQDTAGQSPVVVIDETLARQYFSGHDPIGQHIDDRATSSDKNGPPFTVIGVVGHVRHDAPGENPVIEAMPQLYACVEQFPFQNVYLTVQVKGGDPLRLNTTLRRIVAGLDPELPVSEVATLEHRIADQLAARRLTVLLLGAFAAVALGLAAVGLYGVMSLSVTQRTREMGIRLALGAQRSSVLALVLRQGATLVTVGLGIGLTAALVLNRLLAASLDGTGSDALTLAAVCGLLAGTALLACWLPARRVTRLDPTVALRNE